MAQGKKVKTVVKININAGEATPAPPVGTALGPQGINIMEFVKSYNEKTADKKGQVIPAVITIFEDRTFSFITKTPPVADMIKKELHIEKGSGTPHKDKVGKLSSDQVRRIAQEKMEDLNATKVEQAMKIVAGTARSMGVEVDNG